jgi:hypothetical protein
MLYGDYARLVKEMLDARSTLPERLDPCDSVRRLDAAPDRLALEELDAPRLAWGELWLYPLPEFLVSYF